MTNPEKDVEPPAILIVEDEKIVAKDIELSLRRMGYQVSATASSGKDALRHAAARSPDLVLMDVRIKGQMDGIEAAKLLRERFGLPVVYLTAHADAETLRRARETEPHGYIVKPFRAPELRSTIEIALFKHRMDCRLRERERWFSTTLRGIGDAVVAVDQTGSVTFMNLAAETLLGVSQDGAFGRKLSEIVRLIDDSTGQPVEIPLSRALSERKVVRLPSRVALLGPSGGRPVEDSAAPILDESGNLLGAVVIFRDVSEQQRLQQQLALADRLASLGTLAAGVAHEVNNPLTFILSNASYVAEALRQLKAALERRQGMPQADLSGFCANVEAMIDAVGDIHLGADRVRRIVADLKVFSCPEADRWSSADVVDSIQWALRVTKHHTEQRARIVEDLRPVPPVQASDWRIGQVCINLLVNAAQAIEEGHPEDNEIAVSTGTDESGRVVITVRDTGSGMTTDVLKRIFEPFFTTKPIGSGTGLGLSICHGIVQSVGGEISVQSTLGEGSTFRVVLPVAPAVERPCAVDVPSDVPRATILVIDDEPLMVKMLVRMLEAEHDVNGITNPAKALAVLMQDCTFDLILCDLVMPELTGMDIYEKLLERSPDLASRMAFITAGAVTPRAVDFLASVANPRFEKPFSHEDFLEFVRSCLQIRTATR